MGARVVTAQTTRYISEITNRHHVKLQVTKMHLIRWLASDLVLRALPCLLVLLVASTPRQPMLVRILSERSRTVFPKTLLTTSETTLVMLLAWVLTFLSHLLARSLHVPPLPMVTSQRLRSLSGSLAQVFLLRLLDTSW